MLDKTGWKLPVWHWNVLTPSVLLHLDKHFLAKIKFFFVSRILSNPISNNFYLRAGLLEIGRSCFLSSPRLSFIKFWETFYLKSINCLEKWTFLCFFFLCIGFILQLWFLPAWKSTRKFATLPTNWNCWEFLLISNRAQKNDRNFWSQTSSLTFIPTILEWLIAKIESNFDLQVSVMSNK